MIVPSIDLAGRPGGPADRRREPRRSTPATRARSPGASAGSARSRWSISTPRSATARNAAVIEELLDLAPCRVGGGIRDVASAIAWLDRGALKVVLGTAARPEVLRELPRERVIAALDARHGEVVVEGWQKRTGRGVLERIAELRELVGGFLVTFVEREGRLQGTDLAFAKEIRAAAGAAEVTIAGGITTAEEVARARPPRLRRPGRHGAVHRQAGPRRGVQRAAAQRSPGWPVADRRGRRARHRAWPVLFRP